MTGTMLEDVVILGTDIVLHKGQRVALTTATNLPQGEKYFFAAGPNNPDHPVRIEKESVKLRKRAVRNYTCRYRVIDDEDEVIESDSILVTAHNKKEAVRATCDAVHEIYGSDMDIIHGHVVVTDIQRVKEPTRIY